MEACPWYVNIPLNVVNHRDLSDPLFRTYVQLRVLAWRTNYEETPALRAEELMGWLGCSERSLRGHLAALEGLGLIEVRRRAGRLVIRFLDGEGAEKGAGEEEYAEEGDMPEERQSFAESGKGLPESAKFCRGGGGRRAAKVCRKWQRFAGIGKVLPGLFLLLLLLLI